MQEEIVDILREIDTRISIIKKKFYSGKITINDETLVILKYLKTQIDDMNAVGKLLEKK
ncbi:hypothetical protein CPIN18021_1080 [Campylobacter pinnipediorum subsp. caledonicus]|uniref:Uncharacterized protein n=1 Tax=Campylobacter pinnipediorum subsp. caledonicus TaxID=1874362 RepID=A0A1S6U860_9BACT|nr:hypothetical protein [Campylobacter pinnipediorum]AQW85464.1 hypothetical protein CPIN18020_0217 [Campylobacter pinnipediorum subsp. caledonicus]AQW87879.1 hypothetical protein CPIN18021_1080 [Campylobacter pinnipediorum subsp. caledonicus]